MGLAITATFALGLWLALWSIGAKAMDGLLLAIVIVLVAAGIKMLASVLPGNQSRD